MTDLVETGKVKKQYMKANLIIHPDKVCPKIHVWILDCPEHEAQALNMIATILVATLRGCEGPGGGGGGRWGCPDSAFKMCCTT